MLIQVNTGANAQNMENIAIAKQSSATGTRVYHFVVPYANFNTGGGKRFSAQRRTYYCTYFSNTGHTIDRCYRKNGFPPNKKFIGKPGAVLIMPISFHLTMFLPLLQPV